jgi:hypothetical protein
MDTVPRVRLFLLIAAILVMVAITDTAHAKGRLKDSVDKQTEEMRYAVAPSAKDYEKHIDHAAKQWDRLGRHDGVNIEQVSKQRCSQLDNCVLYRKYNSWDYGVYVPHTGGQDTIKLSRRYFDDEGISNRTKQEIVTHETGHALGFNHANCKRNSVMVGNCFSGKTKPGAYDIAKYEKRWGN